MLLDPLLQVNISTSMMANIERSWCWSNCPWKMRCCLRFGLGRLLQPFGSIWKRHEIANKSWVFFLKNMFSITMSEGASLHEHSLKIKDIWEQLEAIGRKMAEEDTVVITLKISPRSYEYFIETMNIIATDVDQSLESYAISSCNRIRGRNSLGAVVR